MTKDTSYTYDTYNRVKKQTSPLGATATNTYANNNELSHVIANIGPDTYYTYDRFGNQTSQSVYDTDTATNRSFTRPRNIQAMETS